MKEENYSSVNKNIEKVELRFIQWNAKGICQNI